MAIWDSSCRGEPLPQLLGVEQWRDCHNCWGYSNGGNVKIREKKDDSMVISLVETKYKVERVLVDHRREQVKIKGVVNLRTTFGTGPSVKTILLMFTVASYNIILGRSTLNQLRAIVSTSPAHEIANWPTSKRLIDVTKQASGLEAKRQILKK
ncbi:hypothetical protein CR513_06612, partial [Mucuna pruriens]